jgi:hypothetical protein
MDSPRPRDRSATAAASASATIRALLGSALATILGIAVAIAASGPAAAQSASPAPYASPEATAPAPSPESTAPASSPIGVRTSDALGPSLTLELGPGWVERPAIEGPILTFEHTAFPGGVLTITRFDGDAYADSCDPTSLTSVEPSSARIIEVIAGNPWLEAEAPEPVEVGGLQGRSIDVVAPLFGPTECAIPLLLLWAVPMEDGEFVQIGGQSSRFIAVDVGSDTVVIAIETLPGLAFEPFATEAMDVVASMAFATA